MEQSNNGLEFIKQVEGVKLAPYQDSAGFYTVGVGHKILPGEQHTEAITTEEATDLLRHDVAAAVVCVNSVIARGLTQNQFDALVSFVYNVGCNAFRTSTMARFLSQGNLVGAALQFARWTHAGGKEVQGLVNRRAKERELFTS